MQFPVVFSFFYGALPQTPAAFFKKAAQKLLGSALRRRMVG
jgi:hypothetical protein